MAVLDSGPEYVNAGSRMTWTGQFDNLRASHWGESPSDAIAKVSAYLNNNYHLIVEQSGNSISWAGLGSGSISLYLRTDIDRGDGDSDDGLTDIQGNCNDAFSTYLGIPVLGSSITNYKPAGSTGNVAPQNPVPKDSGGEGGDGTSWWNSLVGKVEAGSIGFAVGAVAVIGLIIFIAVKSEV